MPVTAAQWLCFVAVHESGIVARWRFNQHPRTSLPIQPEGSSPQEASHQVPKRAQRRQWTMRSASRGEMEHLPYSPRHPPLLARAKGPSGGNR
jgi:hypothetical protein